MTFKEEEMKMTEYVDFIWEDIDFEEFLYWTDDERYDYACQEWSNRFGRNALISDIRYNIVDADSDEQTISVRVLGYIEIEED